MRKGIVIVTGAAGGIGTEIVRAVALAGYKTIMACQTLEKGEQKRDLLVWETGNPRIEVLWLDLASLVSVVAFTEEIIKRGEPVELLMNNAGTICPAFTSAEREIERTVCVNYVGPWLLTQRLVPLMGPGSRIVNMVSCTFPLGWVDIPRFFTHGRKGGFRKLSVYSNTKLALVLFTLELAERLAEKGITVNAADPGIVSTDMITMHRWYDPLADLFFRPFIRTPRKGAATTVGLLLEERYAGVSGKVCAGNRIKNSSARYKKAGLRKQLWEETERLVRDLL
ncbi:MAG: SDR family NAD(P)-dependent oxidoreductase [Bacteroides sp.]|nr:SDR family NAD(P)-dependent oxidoreductase [Bacteroides sp.]